MAPNFRPGEEILTTFMEQLFQVKTVKQELCPVFVPLTGCCLNGGIEYGDTFILPDNLRIAE